MTITDQAPAPVSPERLAALDRAHPGWRAWEAEPGHLYATYTRTAAELTALRVSTGGHYTGSGVTVHGETPAELCAAIDAYGSLTGPCWADDLPREARAALAGYLARWARSFWDAAEERKLALIAEIDGADMYALGHGLMKCHAEMAGLRTDVTERAEVAA